MAANNIPPPGKGVRYITMSHQMSNCEMFINNPVYFIEVPDVTERFTEIYWVLKKMACLLVIVLS